MTITTAANPATYALSKSVGFGALPGDMPGHIACVAYGIVWTIACQVTCLPTIVASLLVSAVGSNMSLLVAVVAQSHIPWWHCRSCALSSTVSGLTTGVADALIGAVASHVARLPAVPTQRLGSAFRSNVPGQIFYNIIRTMQIQSFKLHRLSEKTTDKRISRSRSILLNITNQPRNNHQGREFNDMPHIPQGTRIYFKVQGYKFPNAVIKSQRWKIFGAFVKLFTLFPTTS